ncbi:methyltransferase [Methylomonas methanica]|uniref:Ribosomal RNA large subunit methyltransferase G n=1 Tax=Methylomonas methanica (strain DSM 25384 / MC09) TaxID=857087 RepID=G0A7K7_METMM|nr:methyltransferase [Methylomonas methanica]AEG01850.1 Ribosomal RNA large subunit methyltransferase G [Methylomonas methanica MC09]
MQTEFESLQARLQLKRLPYRKNDVLQAWDAADSYLLNHLATEDIPAAGSQLTILNDSFGALALALHRYRPTAISDSFLSRQATVDNARLNGLAIAHVALLDSLSLPDRPIDYLLIKVPKTLALLEYQLHSLRPLLKDGSRVIVAGMVKTLTANVWKGLEALIGPTRTSLAVKKARLIFADVDPQLQLPSNPYPVHYRLENTDLLISNHANVFSRESLDIGTRLLLQHLPDNPAQRDIIDLGCGNGIVGLLIAQQLPDARIQFVDESFMAIASAKDNFMRAFAGQRQAEFIVGDCLSGFPENSADCIVCNPPFHQQHVIGDHIAWQMFQQAQRILRKGGELRVIGNRHLNYHLPLKKLFGNWHAVAGNAKFAIIKAHKR